MIPLHVRCTLEAEILDPFVLFVMPREGKFPVHLKRAFPVGFLRAHEGQLVAEGSEFFYLMTPKGPLRFEGISFDELSEDVLLVMPSQRSSHRLIRARSDHNTLLITEQCDQLCIMCSQPPKKRHLDQFEHFKVAARLAPANAVIGLSGGEPTLHKSDVFAFLREALKVRPDLSFHILTNAQHFEACDLDELRSMPRGRVQWGVPIYSSDASEHDRIVGKIGAFERLTQSLSVLLRAQAHVELRTVLIRDNASSLGELALFVGRHLNFTAVWAIMQLENIGFAKNAWGALFWDHSVDFLPVARAIDTAEACGIDVALYNFPRCTVPRPYRRLAAASISDWKQRFLVECDECAERNVCSGFFEWYPEACGYSRIQPI